MVKYVCKIKKETYRKELEKMEFIVLAVFAGVIGGCGLVKIFDIDERGGKND